MANITVETHATQHPFELYLPEGPGPFYAVFMTPILGRFAFLEDLFFERIFARYFANHGLASVLIHRPIFEYNPKKGLEQVQSYLVESMKRNRRVLDHIFTLPQIKKVRAASFGMSFGSIVNLLWACDDARLHANVFALPGGRLNEIFTTSCDPLMKSYFKAAQENTDLDTEALCKKLKDIFILDPLEACENLDPDQCLFILARFDRVVPFRYGLELWEKTGRPEAIFLPLGHYLSVLAAPFLLGKVTRFLKKTLEE